MAKYLTLHRASSHNKEFSAPNVNNSEVEKPCCRLRALEDRDYAIVIFVSPLLHAQKGLPEC